MAKKKKIKAKDAETPEGASPEKTGPGIVSQLAIALVLGVASFATVYLLPSQNVEPVTDHAQPGHKADPMEGVFPTAAETTFVALDDLTLTLGELERILKIGITLETVDSGDTYIDPSNPVLRDAFTGYLRALRVEQIQDPSFMVQLRTQLLRRAQLVLGADVVHGVLITDFLVR